MDIKFSRKEEKEGSIDTKKTHFTLCYLVAIKESNPSLWKHLVSFINNVNEKDFGGEDK